MYDVLVTQGITGLKCKCYRQFDELIETSKGIAKILGMGNKEKI